MSIRRPHSYSHTWKGYLVKKHTRPGESASNSFPRSEIDCLRAFERDPAYFGRMTGIWDEFYHGAADVGRDLLSRHHGVHLAKEREGAMIEVLDRGRFSIFRHLDTLFGLRCSQNSARVDKIAKMDLG